ncbi:MAG: hypothetical protein ACPGFB_03110 [Verrucomicrobiales bacterium]
MTKHATPQNGPDNALVGGETLLEIVFPDERDRPSLRWLAAMRQRRLIPYRKIGGRMIRYDVGEVKAAIKRNFYVEAK